MPCFKLKSFFLQKRGFYKNFGLFKRPISGCVGPLDPISAFLSVGFEYLETICSNFRKIYVISSSNKKLKLFKTTLNILYEASTSHFQLKVSFN